MKNTDIFRDSFHMNVSNNDNYKKLIQIILIIILLIATVQKILANPMVRIKMKGMGNTLEETVVYYQAGASSGFDAGFDAYFMAGPNAAPHIYQVYNSISIAVNGIPPVCNTFSIQLKTTSPVTGNFTIFADDFEGLPIGTKVYLKDVLTGATCDLLANDYVFLLDKNTIDCRFELSIVKSPDKLSFNSVVKQATCTSSLSAQIKVQGTEHGPFNYTWKDSENKILKSSLQTSLADSLFDLKGGTYKLEIVSVNDCYANDTSFVIHEIIVPMVDFMVDDTIEVGEQNFKPINVSHNCLSYAWDFGDNTQSNQIEPVYSFLVPGVYQVKLIGISASSCSTSISKLITVNSITTGIKKQLLHSFKLANLSNNEFKVMFEKPLEFPMQLKVYSLQGQLQMQTNTIDGGEVLVNLSAYHKGIYILVLEFNHQAVLSHKLIVND